MAFFRKKAGVGEEFGWREGLGWPLEKEFTGAMYRIGGWKGHGGPGTIGRRSGSEARGKAGKATYTLLLVFSEDVRKPVGEPGRPAADMGSATCRLSLGKSVFSTRNYFSCKTVVQNPGN